MKKYWALVIAESEDGEVFTFSDYFASLRKARGYVSGRWVSHHKAKDLDALETFVVSGEVVEHKWYGS